MINIKTLRLIIVVFLSIGLLGIIYAVATNGRIVIKNQGDKAITIVKIIDNDQRSEFKEIGNGSIVSSGRYILQNNLNGNRRIVSVKVPGWLQSTTVSFDQIPTARLTKQATLTYEHFLPLDPSRNASYTDLQSFMNGYTIHPTGDAFGGNYIDTPLTASLDSPITLSDGSVIGIRDREVVRADLKTNTVQPYSQLKLDEKILETDDDTTFPVLMRSRDLENTDVGIYQKQQERLSSIKRNGTTTTRTVSIGSAKTVQFDTNSKGAAIVRSETIADATEEDKPYDYVVRLFINGSDKSKDIPVGRTSDVKDIALSPDASFVAVITDDEMRIFNTQSGELTMVDVFSSTSQLFWRGDKLYSISTDGGVSVFNLKNNQELSLTSSGETGLSFSSFTPVGSQFYVTAYNKKEYSKLPDGFVLDLSQKDDGVTRALADTLPLRQDGYEITYLDHMVYIRSDTPGANSSDDSQREQAKAKERGNKKINSLLSADVRKKITIVYR